MKYTPKKIFIKKNNGYAEITCEEFCRRRSTDKIFVSKKFIPINSMLMEVSPEQYGDFYKQCRRQRYLKECAVKNGEISIDMLTTDEFCGEEILVDESGSIDDKVIENIMLEKLRECFGMLTSEEKMLINELFVKELTEREVAARHGVSQAAVHKRKEKILNKLRKMM